MGKPAVLAFVLLLLFGAAYGSSPYWAVRQFRDAAVSADADRLEAVVDFPAVRENLKSQLDAALTAKMNDDASFKSNPFGGLGMMLIPTIVGKIVDGVVTPEGISALIKRGQFKSSADTDPQSQEDISTEEGYVDLHRFRVILRKRGSDDADPVQLTFERRGIFAWKLVRIKPPERLLTDKKVSEDDSTGAADESAPSLATTTPASPTQALTPYVQPSLGADSLSFADYPAEALNGSFVLPDFSLDPGHANYRTRLTEAAMQGMNFAGHFALTQIGCGTECNFAMAVDGNSGRTIDFPLGGEEYPQLNLVYQPNSRLVKAYWNPDEDDSPTCEHADFVQDGSAFRRLEGDGKRARCPS